MATIFDKKVLMGVYEQSMRPSNFLKRIFFPTPKNSLTPNIELDFKKHKRRASAFVSPIKGGVINEKETFSTNAYKIPTVGECYVLNAENEAFERQAGEAIYGARMAEKVGGYLQEHDNYISRSEIIACKDLLTTGVITVNEKNPDGTAGASWAIDFTLTNKEVLGAGFRWDEATSDPIADLKRWKKDVVAKAGVSPRVCVLEPEAATAFVNNPKTKDQLNTRRVELGHINPTELEPGVIYLGTLSSLGLEMYEYQEQVYNGTDDVDILPKGTVLMGPGTDRWVIGPIALHSNNNGQDFSEPEIFTKPRVAHSWIENGKKRNLETLARFIPLVGDIDGYFCATVIV